MRNLWLKGANPQWVGFSCFRGIALCMVMLVSNTQIAYSQSQIKAYEKLDDLYSQVLEDPANLELLYAYAQEGIYVSNFEAAISALEGMLVVSRRQPRVLFELGTLYQRLGAHKVAQSYFIRAKALFADGEGVPDYMEEYFVKSEAENSQNVFSGMLMLGYRYQENPRLSPESAEIFSRGGLIPLPPGQVEESDQNYYLVSTLNHKYKVNSSTSIKSRALLFATDYDENEQLNYSALELTSGPEILMASSGDRLSLRPHVILRESILNDDDLESSWGAGVEGAYALSTQSSLRWSLQYRDRDFNANNGKEQISLRTGEETRFRLNWNSEIKRGHFLSTGLRFSDITTQIEESSYGMLSLSAKYSIRFKNIFAKEVGKQSINFSIVRRNVEYDGSNSRINDQIIREDDEWRYSISSFLPLKKNLGLLLKLESVDRDSNLANYVSKNNLISLALRLTFK
ncbi:MAG: hypothetical protein ACI8P9_002285 [Parasphingorhabdus sp.]|jgi:hypothetical protein